MSKYNEYFLIVLIYSFSILFFVPYGYEPLGETMNEWAAAKMLLNGNGFPTTQIPIGYVFYAAFFLNFFEYPNVIFLEFLITFSSFFIIMHLTLRTKLDVLSSILICLALTPTIILVEGHNIIISCSFFFLYLKSVINNKSSDVNSIYLLMASIFHTVFFPFLLGHFLAYIIINKKKFLCLSNIKFLIKSRKFIFYFFILFVYLFSFNNQSPSDDNNYFMIRNNWAPIKIESPLEIGVFQIVPHYHSVRNFDKQTVLNQDWYFTAPQIFNDAKTLKEVFLKAPDVMIENIIVNLKSLGYMPNTFLFQVHSKFFIIISILLSTIVSVYGVYWLYLKKHLIPMTSIFIGVVTSLSVLLLTWTHNFRYNIIYLPLFLTFFVIFFGSLKSRLVNSFLKELIPILFSMTIFICSMTSLYNKEIKIHGLNLSNVFKVEGGFSDQFINLKSFLKNDEVIMYSNPNYLKVIFNFDSKNIIPVNKLPPFKNQNITNSMLSKIDKIWIDNQITKPHITVGMNNHLRYNLIIKPYLFYKNWNFKDFGSLGKIYYK